MDRSSILRASTKPQSRPLLRISRRGRLFWMHRLLAFERSPYALALLRQARPSGVRIDRRFVGRGRLQALVGAPAADPLPRRQIGELDVGQTRQIGRRELYLRADTAT